MNKVQKEILTEVLESNFAMTLGTVIDNKPHLCTIFYVTPDNKHLYFKSRTESDHSKAFAKNPNAAVSVYMPGSNYTKRKSGIQTRGIVERVKDLKEMTKVVALYVKAFKGSEKKLESLPELVSDFVKSTMYKYTIQEVKVMDSSREIHDTKYSNL